MVQGIEQRWHGADVFEDGQADNSTVACDRLRIF